MTSDEIIIREAAEDHIPDMLAIEAACGLSEWSARAYRDELQRTESFILLALRHGGEVAGFLAGRVPFGSDAEIYNIGVRPNLHRLGVGSRLLTRFIDRCRKQGAGRICLEVRASNHGAQAFYMAFGFTKVGLRRSFYTRPVEDAELYNLELQRESIQDG